MTIFEPKRIICNKEYALDIVGESYHRDAFVEICGALTETSRTLRRFAVLKPEPGNEFDENAVAVQIWGMTVGYLPRKIAKQWSDRLFSQGVPAIECEALISTGWIRRDGSEGHYGVSLDIDLSSALAAFE